MADHSPARPDDSGHSPAEPGDEEGSRLSLDPKPDHIRDGRSTVAAHRRTSGPALESDVLTRAEAAERATKISGPAYEVRLDLTAGEETFRSETTVRFAANLVGLSSFIDLEAERILEMTLNGRALDVDQYDQARARIPLRGLVANNTLRVVAECRYQHTGVGLHRFVDPTDANVYLHTQFEPYDAHRVFACFDQPDIKGPFTLTVRAPEDWTVVSNSPLVGRPGGEWSFGATPEISTYLAALVAGPYHVVRDTHADLDLALYCRRSLAQHLDAEELFALTKAGLAFYEAEFAIPYPFDKYDQLFVPEFNFGAMENPGCITFNESFVFRARQTASAHERRADVILHEMAHMWFGDLVTMRWWDDLWLNESFATYMSCAALARATPFDRAWVRFAAATKAVAATADQMRTTHPISADIIDTDAVRLHFDGITYSKGASVLRQLVAWVGQDAFRRGMQAYFNRHAWGNAELSDFLAALERASGRELGSWVGEWIQTTGINTLRPECEIAEGRYTAVSVAQEAGGSGSVLRSHRVAVGLYDLSPADNLIRRRRQLEVDLVGADTPVTELAGEAAADLLIVNDDDLTYAKMRLDPRSLATVDAHLSRVADPLARNLCWAAAWDMTRDAEMSARRWIGLVSAHAPDEDDETTLALLLGRAVVAADFYADPAQADGMGTGMAEAARAHLGGAEAGSDHQLVWTRHLLATGRGPEHAAWCEGLLAGSVEVPGLAVDTDLRWLVVGALARAGADGALALVAAEVDRDPTDIGRRRGAAALASMPAETQKAEAWDKLMTPGTHLAEIRAVAGSFWICGQDAILESYSSRYFAALGTWWAERTPDETLSLAKGLFPSTLVSAATLSAAKAALADDSLPGPLRRVLLEGADGVARALRARAFDGAEGQEVP
ncbi:MAG: aminopeptidase N [Acidimicrobiales bacterium]